MTLKLYVLLTSIAIIVIACAIFLELLRTRGKP